MDRKYYFNYNKVSTMLILILSIILKISSFPIYNLQSAQLNSGEFFLIHNMELTFAMKIEQLLLEIF